MGIRTFFTPDLGLIDYLEDNEYHFCLRPEKVFYSNSFDCDTVVVNIISGYWVDLEEDDAIRLKLIIGNTYKLIEHH